MTTTRLVGWLEDQSDWLSPLVVKEVQEWAIHGARLFDNMSSLQVLSDVWGRLTGR